MLSAAAREVRLPVPHATPLLTSTPQPTVEPARTVQPSNALLSLGMIGIPEGQANFQRFSHGRSLHASGERRWRVAFDPDSAEPSTVSLEARFDLPASAKRGEFFGVVELGVDRDVEVEVKFVEPGAPPGGHPPQRLRVVAGVPCVTCLRTRFGPHSRSAALQLEIVAPLPGTQFTLGTVILIDTNMATASEPALRVANELFRSGGFDAALIMYLHLYSRTRLEMYARNALLCARQMRRTEQAAELT